jgi:hypothetical protein
MRRAIRQAARSVAIDLRTRARRIANLRSRQSFARKSEAERVSRLAWLKQLAGAIEGNSFTAADRMDAEAALTERNPRQQRLDLGTSRDART